MRLVRWVVIVWCSVMLAVVCPVILSAPPWPWFVSVGAVVWLLFLVTGVGVRLVDSGVWLPRSIALFVTLVIGGILEIGVVVVAMLLPIDATDARRVAQVALWFSSPLMIGMAMACIAMIVFLICDGVRWPRRGSKR
jgi:hypothetical protein